ncbi:MAG: aminotransferase class I/II-fold pyridoxal phosphate-dependent enzyme [Gammaproteobacteria bacterium]|nr:aminotransferase class I/II-fold pyridoxal phosphate-dependent enzyme [Gammaproteobacteria bacterium]
MQLLEKFSVAGQLKSGLEQAGHDPTDVVFDTLISATEGTVDGRTTILAGTNNYLGLTFDPDCIEAGVSALKSNGTGTTGSRMANGSYAAHRLLENDLADFYQCANAMVFSTGYAANLGVLTALLGKGDAVLLDSDAHASLYDGCKMSNADIYRFKHNGVQSLERRLERLGDRASRCLIVVEGMYSVLGDCAPLAEIVEVKERFGAMLLVDEAHSLGVYGERGCGLAEAQGVLDKVDFVVGTFSKSLGAMGGFCASPHDVLGLFRYVSRPFMFTASPSPAVMATTREALHKLRTRPELRDRLWSNARQLYTGLENLGFELGPEVSPVVAVRCKDRETALSNWNQLLEAGVYVNMMLPPATPGGASFLRCSISAAHTPEQISTVIGKFAELDR